MTRGSGDRQTVPVLLRRFLYWSLLIAGAAGAVTLDGYSPVPATVLLDVWIIVFILGCVLRGSTQRVGLVLLLGLYLASRVALAVMSSSPIEDFLQAYRWLLYLVAFTMAVGRRWGPVGPLRTVSLLLIGMAVVKAALVSVLVGAGERPGLLVENNFEIALFCGLLVVLYRDLTGAQRFGGVAMLGALMVLAQSRSGAVAFAVLLVYVLSQARVTTATKVFIGVYALPAVLSVPLLVFSERAQSTRIDRLNFLDVFLVETSRWDVVQWLFGTTPITPLSPGSCARLSYYQTLFASAGDGTCYSVILHAFLLRVVFDAGVIGLMIAFWVPWRTMRWGGVPTSASLALLAIAAANSFSVSGLNNAYVALPILLAIALAGNGEPESEPDLGEPAVLSDVVRRGRRGDRGRGASAD